MQATAQEAATPERGRTASARLRAALAGALFPEAPPQRWSALAAFAAVAALCAGGLLSLWRQDGAAVLDSIWAEDGGTFLNAAYSDGMAAVLEPYAGYMHLLPRLAALVAAAAPPSAAAEILALVAAGTTAVCGLVLFAATAAHVRNRALRALLAAFVVASPVALLESLNVVALSQFHLAGVLPWVLLWRPRERWGSTLALGTAVLAAFSAALAVLAAPLALARLLAVPGWRDRWVALVVLAGAAVQLAVYLTSGVLEPPPAPAAVAAAAFAQHVVGGAILGLTLNAEVWELLGWNGVLVTGAALLALLLAGAVAADASRRWVAAVLLLAAPAAYAVSAPRRIPLEYLLYEPGIDVARLAPGAQPGMLGSRFLVVPVLLVVSALVVLADRVVERSGRYGAVAVAAVTLALAVPVLIDLQGHSFRVGGPRWDAAVAEAAASCDGDTGTARVQVRPAALPFTVQLPCTRLTAS